jgi:hypothetical protein
MTHTVQTFDEHASVRFQFFSELKSLLWKSILALGGPQYCVNVH